MKQSYRKKIKKNILANPIYSPCFSQTSLLYLANDTVAIKAAFLYTVTLFEFFVVTPYLCCYPSLEIVLLLNSEKIYYPL